MCAAACCSIIYWGRRRIKFVRVRPFCVESALARLSPMGMGNCTIAHANVINANNHEMNEKRKTNREEERWKKNKTKIQSDSLSRSNARKAKCFFFLFFFSSYTRIDIADMQSPIGDGGCGGTTAILPYKYIWTNLIRTRIIQTEWL